MISTKLIKKVIFALERLLPDHRNDEPAIVVRKPGGGRIVVAGADQVLATMDDAFLFVDGNGRALRSLPSAEVASYERTLRKEPPRLWII